MGRPYSDDLRERVLKEAEQSSARRAAARFGISAATAVRWVARARLGERSARPWGGRRGSRLDAHAEFVEAMIQDRKNDRVFLVAHRRRTDPGKPGPRVDGDAFHLANFDHCGLGDVVDVFEEDGRSTLSVFGENGPAPNAEVPTDSALERHAGRIDACMSQDGGALPHDLRTNLPEA